MKATIDDYGISLEITLSDVSKLLPSTLVDLQRPNQLTPVLKPLSVELACWKDSGYEEVDEVVQDFLSKIYGKKVTAQMMKVVQKEGENV